MTRRWRAVVVSGLAVVAALVTGPPQPVIAASSTGRIQGTVTAADTGQPLAGVCVGFYGAPPSDVIPKGTAAYTDADGRYDAEVPIGRTLVTTEAGFYCATGRDDYAGELYDDVTDIGAATPVDVRAGQASTGVDFALSRPSHVTGTVTADADGAPVAGVCVDAVSGSSFDWGGGATTGPDGSYDIGGLSAGEFRIDFRDCTTPIDFVAETYDDQANYQLGMVVPVGVEATVTGIDASLATAGHITGTVTDDATGAPVREAFVHASWRFPLSPEGPYYALGQSDLTDAEGRYDIGGLPGGNYAVSFAGDGRYASETYDGIFLGEDYDPVSVPYGSVVSGIDAGLRPGCRSRVATVDLRFGEVPTEGADVIRGTAGDDEVHALGGDDLVCGMGGADVIDGGDGRDSLYGQGGADDLRGGRFRDLVYGGNGADRLLGGRGDDFLSGEGGVDDCGGGMGLDAAVYCEQLRGVP